MSAASIIKLQMLVKFQGGDKTGGGFAWAGSDKESVKIVVAGDCLRSWRPLRGCHDNNCKSDEMSSRPLGLLVSRCRLGASACHRYRV